MKGTWNLDPIYRGFDDPAFAADLKELKEKVAQASAFAATLENAQPMEGLKEGIRLQEDVTALTYKLAGYASLRQAADTKDSEAGSRMGQIMAAYSGFAGPDAAFKAWASKTGIHPTKHLPSGDNTTVHTTKCRHGT